MKPIGNNADPSTSSMPHTGELMAATSSSATRRSGTRSTSGTRLEDIIGVAPKAVREKIESSVTAVAADFHDRLTRRMAECRTMEDAWAAAAKTLTAQADFEFIGRFAGAGKKIGQSAILEGLTADITSLSVQSQQLVRELESLSAVVGSTKIHGSRGICVSIGGDVDQTLIGVLPESTAQRFPVDQRSAIELAATKISEWHVRCQLQDSERHVQHVAAIVDLVSRISSSRQPDHAARRITEDLCQYLKAERVYLGTCRTPRAACRLSAVSNTEIDRLSKHCQQSEAVLQESIARGSVSVWPAPSSDGRHALLSHQQFASEHGFKSVVATPLRVENGDAIGAIFAVFDDTADAEAFLSAATFFRASEQPVAAAIQSLTRTSQGLFAQMASGVKRILSGHRWKVCVAAIACFTAAMFAPVDYRVNCDAELQPVSRRFVAAPFDAPLQECLVAPGDVVESGQLLAMLDGRELRWELSGVRADVGKATKEHNAFLSERKSGEAAIARHEIDRLQTRADLLTQRTRNLEVRSPLTGIVVAGDLKETEGVPLQTGQSMFEIAPLDRMVIEVAIPEEDVRHVQPGMPVRLILDSMPAGAIEAKIMKVNPRAELRDHENVFIAEAEIDNADRQLRPGMRGQAKVSTGTRSLGWTLFHKPFAHVVGWLGW